MLTILTFVFSVVCLIGTVATMNIGNQGSFWLGWLLREYKN
jgi:hypothetical protein